VTDHPLQPVLSHYGLHASQVHIQPLSNAGGWSGSLLWHITDTANQPFCLRRWPPEHPTSERLQFIHNVLLTVARDFPVVPSPLRTTTGETFIHNAGRLWELTNWLPGLADFHAHPSTTRLRAAMHALAKFHQWATSCGRRVGAAPAISDRIRQLNTVQDKGWLEIQRATNRPLASSRADIADRAVRMWNLLKPIERWTSLAGRLSTVGELALQPAIRDIHHDHVLFSSDEVTGIVDFGAMRIDTPLTDIARLIASLVGDDWRLRQLALDAYSELRSLDEANRQIVELLDESGLFLGGVNWLTWLYVERRDMGPDGPIVRRLDEIIRRLEGRST
jgi:Ser/Thr protein kinase RdoA (MazF antagonist)